MNGAYLQCKLLEKKAMIESVKCRVAGMQAENEDRCNKGHAQCYNEQSFFEAGDDLAKLSSEVRDLGDQYAKAKGWME